MKPYRTKHKIDEFCPPKDQLVMGLHCVSELLIHVPERLIHVYCSRVVRQGRTSDLIAMCEKKKIPYTIIDEEILDKIAGTDSHQSVVAHIKSRFFLSISEFLKRVEGKESSLVLMIDQIFDPQNFGTLIRGAECLGADAIIWSKNRGTDLTPAAAKASCGASELLPLIRISNLAEAVTEFQSAGYEAVASVLNEKSQDAYRFSFSAKTLLIVGSEGDGIQPLIQKRADRLVFIPMRGKVQSLNVAQAASLLMGLFQSKLINN